MTDRLKAARWISIAGCIASWVIAWQAVRFCEGHIGTPGLNQFFAVMNENFGPWPNPDTATGPQWIFAWFYRLYYYLGGITIWVALSAAVWSLVSAIARIVEVGFKQYMVECKEAQEEAQSLAKIESDRLRRRSLRRKRIDAQQPKSSFGFGTLLLGIIIGKIL